MPPLDPAVLALDGVVGPGALVGLASLNCRGCWASPWLLHPKLFKCWTTAGINSGLIFSWSSIHCFWALDSRAWAFCWNDAAWSS
eukprot:10220886-Heterocapsa_arctica.AAC.1